MAQTRKTGEATLVWLLALVLVGTGAVSLWRGSHGIDYVPFYLTGKLLNEGRPVYDLKEKAAVIARDTPQLRDRVEANAPMFYPPSAVLLLSPLSFFSLATAKKLFWLFEFGILLGGLLKLSVVAAPRWKPESRMLLMGITLQASAIRGGMELLQIAPLVLGLFCFFLAALIRGHEKTLFCLLVLALALKFTLAPPFLVLAFLFRRAKMAGASLGAVLLFNGIGFLAMGGPEAVRSYRAGLAQVEAFPVNAPDPHLAASAERVDLIYLLNGLFSAPFVARIGVVVVVLGAGVWIVRAWVARPPELPEEISLALFCAPTVCLTLMAVYHHTPDACLLLAPALLFLAFPMLSRTPAVRLFLGSVVFFVVLRPGFRETASLLGSLLHKDRVVLEKMVSSAALTVCLLASLVSLFSKARTADPSAGRTA